MSYALGRPYFGQLDSVDVENYIEETDEAPPGVYVVVLLYQPYIETCVRLSFSLMNLAEQFQHVHFVRGIASELLPSLVRLPSWSCYRFFRACMCVCSFSYYSPNFPITPVLLCPQDEVALPALLVYRDGIQEQTLVRVTDDVGDNFADKDVVAFLTKYAPGFIFRTQFIFVYFLINIYFHAISPDIMCLPRPPRSTSCWARQRRNRHRWVQCVVGHDWRAVMKIEYQPSSFSSLLVRAESHRYILLAV
jgi:hypothetical protein